jgi:site-specific DNA-methyltransferase (adenine-specific)
MTPYYDEAGITIYCGDCLDVLDRLALADVAAVVMDPPYASGARTEAAKPASGAMVRGARWNAKPIENDQMTTAGFVWLMREVLLRMRGALVLGGSVLSFIDWRQWPNLVGAVESANLRTQGMVVWDKGSFGLGNGFRVQHELVLHASSGVPRVYNRGLPNILRHARVDNVDHPSPKPVGLMANLLSVVADVGDLVVDPFMGAGATLVAAKSCGMRAVGIECSEKHCETAAARLRQTELFAPRTAAQKAEQMELVK